MIQLQKLAEKLALEAGKAVLELRKNSDFSADTKSSSVDVVTTADKKSEEMICAGIEAARPQDSILGEEGANKTGTSDITWHIDPIDGTTNFVYGRDFAISIAAAVGNDVLAGVVYEPMTETLYSASKDAGAFCNKQPIRCTDKNELATALIGTGFSYHSDIRKAEAELLVKLLPKVRDIRRGGSAALDLCHVACGLQDAYFEKTTKPWDVAAGTIIALEAGAVVTEFDPIKSQEPVVASAPRIFEELFKLVAN